MTPPGRPVWSPVQIFDRVRWKESQRNRIEIDMDPQKIIKALSWWWTTHTHAATPRDMRGALVVSAYKHISIYI